LLQAASEQFNHFEIVDAQCASAYGYL